jgi:hypothetical protein
LDCHLEREIRFSEESECKNLYSWSLQEFNEEGEKIGSDQVPWTWSLYYTASELRHHHSIEIDRSNESGNGKNHEPVQKSETIYAILHPGTCRDGKWLEDDTSYSMFGTNRRVKKFGLWIRKLKDDDGEERCSLWGCVSYTTEIDLRYETTDDVVEIYLSLAPKRYNSLVDLIKDRRANIVQMRLGRVSGFYSEWSPSISTNSIKILAASEDQKIILPENCEISPPRLGDVGEFNLTIVERNIINPKQDLRGIDIDKLFEEPDDCEEGVCERREHTEYPPDTISLLLTQIGRNETVLAKLRTPLWLIFVVLLLLLLQRVF